MINRSQFKRPDIALEGGRRNPAEIYIKCPSCKKMLLDEDLTPLKRVCPKCGHHFRITPRERIAFLFDDDSFEETNSDMVSQNPISFPGYDEKLRAAQRQSGENEAVITGEGDIAGFRCAAFMMDARFMMGSMGTVVGEKLTLLFERALSKRLPVVGFTVSGGARMQEGILSLMQMAKVSGAVGRHGGAGLFYLAVLTDPTTGGVTASFAMQGDITLAEPGALIAFAGPRVIEQTIRRQLPEGFQKAEMLLEKGFIDAIVPRDRQRQVIATLLRAHTLKEDAHD